VLVASILFRKLGNSSATKSVLPPTLGVFGTPEITCLEKNGIHASILTVFRDFLDLFFGNGIVDRTPSCPPPHHHHFISVLKGFVKVIHVFVVVVLMFCSTYANERQCKSENDGKYLLVHYLHSPCLGS
jgi:hypothetical protein